MPQARGAQAQMLMQRESVFRTAPSPAAARLIPFSVANFGRNTVRQANNTVNAQPLPAKNDKGDTAPSGTFTSIFDLRSIGNWLALLLGVPTAYKHVSKQPTNVTGVTIHYAQASAPAGNGTLTYTQSGTTLTWTAQGQSAGTPVNVSAGGNFLIPSGTASSGIYVTVAPGALPGSNVSDTNIAVHSTMKAHNFPINLTDRPSALIEIGHTGINKFQRFLGCKLNQLSFDAMSTEQNVSGSCVIAHEVDPIPTSVFDGAPTSYSHVRACSANGKVWDGSGTTLGSIRAATLQFDNQMTGVPLADGLEGYGQIDQGDLVISGEIDCMFTGGDAYQLARDNTSTRLRLEMGAAVGADTFSLMVDLLDVELSEAPVQVEGKSGLWVRLPFRAHNNGSRLPVITLNNDVTSF